MPRQKFVMTLEERLLHDPHYVPPDTRLFVMNRDGKKCTRCGTPEELVVHHIAPVSEGGGPDPDNLVVLCMACHKKVHEERGDWYASLMVETRVGMPPRKKRGTKSHKTRIEKYDPNSFWVYQRNIIGLLDEVTSEARDGEIVWKRAYSLADIGMLCAMMIYAQRGTNQLVHPDTQRPLTISDFARHLGMSRKHVSLSLAELERKGLVATLAQWDGTKHMMVNPQLMWNGNSEMLNGDKCFKAFHEVSPVTGKWIPKLTPAVSVVYKECERVEKKAKSTR